MTCLLTLVQWCCAPRGAALQATIQSAQSRSKRLVDHRHWEEPECTLLLFFLLTCFRQPHAIVSQVPRITGVHSPSNLHLGSLGRRRRPAVTSNLLPFCFSYTTLCVRGDPVEDHHSGAAIQRYTHAHTHKHKPLLLAPPMPCRRPCRRVLACILLARGVVD